MIRRWSCLVMAAAAYLWSASSTAQPAEKKFRIGFLVWSSCDHPSLMKSLAELGYVAGRNLIVECRSANGRYDGLPTAAGALAGLKLDVIVATTHPTARAASEATKTTPIVMIASGDPVASGLVKSLAQPGGNVTGLTYYATELTAKRVELIRELVPSLRSIGVLVNPHVAYLPFEEDTRRASEVLGLRAIVYQVKAAEDLSDAIASMARENMDAVILTPDLMQAAEAKHIAMLALRHRLPSMGWGAWFTDAGVLMSYSAEYASLNRSLSVYIDKILRGAKPVDLPIDQPTRFRLSINRGTARALRIAIPPAILARADEVIE